MAYGGYLIKIGSNLSSLDNSNNAIPFKYIKADTYSVVWSTTDVDSFRNANGELVRNTVLPNKVMKIEFETPDMSDSEYEELMSMIRSRYTDSIEKCLYVRAWVPEMNAYKMDKCYVPDINVSIRFANGSGIRYNPVRIAFIGYSTTVAQ